MIQTIRNESRKVINSLRDMHRSKYLPYSKVVSEYFKNSHLNYQRFSLEDIISFKTSGTIFILGSGPSLNRISQQQWEHIARHDSFGMNFSFLKDHVPTFYQPAYHSSGWSKETFDKFFPAVRDKYTEAIWMLSDKALMRFIHPRLLPQLFPPNPKVCYYDLPVPINLESDRDFTDADFDKTVYYRGTMTLVLDCVCRLGYKNIVMLGVDLETYEHFFFDLGGMERYVRMTKEEASEVGYKFETMTPKSNKFRTMDEYYYALSDYLKRKRDTNLYVSFKNNLLCPGIEAYFE